MITSFISLQINTVNYHHELIYLKNSLVKLGKLFMINMKITTPCEEAYRVEVPVLRIAIAKKLIERGMPVVKAAKTVGISATTYEKQIKEKWEEVRKVLEDEEVGDMIESLVGRILSNQLIEPTSFCLLCSRARRLFDLTPCPNF